MPPKPRPLPKMSDRKLMSKFAGNTINEINQALERTKEGGGRGGKGKLVKLRKLQDLGGLTKLPVKVGWRVGKVGKPVKFKGLAESPRHRARTPPGRKKAQEGVPPRGKKPSEGVPPPRTAKQTISKIKTHKAQEDKALHDIHKGGGYGRKDTGITHGGMGTAYRTDHPTEFVQFKTDLTLGKHIGRIPPAIPMGDEGFVPVPRGHFPNVSHVQVGHIPAYDKKAVRRRKIQKKMKAHGLI